MHSFWRAVHARAEDGAPPHAARPPPPSSSPSLSSPLEPPPPPASPRPRPAQHLTAAEHQAAERESFFRFLRFGVVDSSLLMISILAGFSLDGVIARRIGARGYGPIVGAGIGNLCADTIAGMPEGKAAALGVFAGAAIPLAPIALAMTTRRPLTGTMAYMVGGASAVLFAGTFYSGLARNREHIDAFDEK